MRLFGVISWGRQKVESYVFFFFFSSSTLGGIMGGSIGGKEDMDLGQSERSASEAGWSRVVGGEPRSLIAAGFNPRFSDRRCLNAIFNLPHPPSSPHGK